MRGAARGLTTKPRARGVWFMGMKGVCIRGRSEGITGMCPHGPHRVAVVCVFLGGGRGRRPPPAAAAGVQRARQHVPHRHVLVLKRVEAARADAQPDDGRRKMSGSNGMSDGR
jgi:hypothetical protein